MYRSTLAVNAKDSVNAYSVPKPAHVFTDHIEILETTLQHLRWFYEKEQVSIKKGPQYVEYTHIYLEADFPIELSVYPRSELQVVTRSSTDGKPIKRLKLDSLCDVVGTVSRLLPWRNDAEIQKDAAEGVHLIGGELDRAALCGLFLFSLMLCGIVGINRCSYIAKNKNLKKCQRNMVCFTQLLLVVGLVGLAANANAAGTSRQALITSILRVFAYPANLPLSVVDTVTIGEIPRGIVLSKDGSVLYMYTSDEDHVEVLNIKTLKVTHSLPLGPDSEFMQLMQLNPEGIKLYIANEDDNLVTLVNVDERTKEVAIPVGIEPEGIGVSPDGKWLVNTSESTDIAHFTNTDTLIDLKKRRVIKSVKVGRFPWGLAISE